MTGEQRALIVEVIDSNCTVKGALLLVDASGAKSHCIIGGLMASIGLERYGGAPNDRERKLLEEKFGLGIRTLLQLMAVNDEHNGLEERRAALRKLVEVLA